LGRKKGRNTGYRNNKKAYKRIVHEDEFEGFLWLKHGMLVFKPSCTNFLAFAKALGV
jgi:hypothetical protein